MMGGGNKRPTSAPSKPAQDAPQVKRQRADDEYVPGARAADPPAERRVRRPQPAAPAPAPEPTLSRKRNPGPLKKNEEGGIKQEQTLDFSDPKMLAALQKYKAATPAKK
jgi:hypothetical protein